MFKQWRFGRSMSFRWRVGLILPIWTFCALNMLLWWFSQERVDYFPLFALLSAAMVYEFVLLPTVFLYFLSRARYPKKRIAQKNLKVAVISLCVPKKESLNIIEKQLKAMKEIQYPHDSWILDEGGSKEVEKLAKKYKVKYFTRKGLRKYNQSGPPFKKRTKAGNVNAWLDHVKRRKYEFFVQLDIDHLPNPDYLNQTLGYFRDGNVAWVQAPSVYRNRSVWIARGAAEQELVLQGPLQMGFYGHSSTPFIIGSHSTYRTKAINEIGGFQPTRAEDHLDTVALASKGYKGVFLPKIIAEGDGPETLRTYLAQQFAWAYSMFQVLIGYSPKLLRTMPLKQKLQFLFAQTWYPVWSVSYLAMFFTPILALYMNQNVAHVNAKDFVTHFGLLFVGSFLVWWAGRPLMQPASLRLSWRGILLHAIRWPAVLQAIIYAAFKIKRSYMITPKGSYAKQKPSTKVYMPFLLLGFLSCSAIIFSNIAYDNISSEGQIIFALMNALFMASICIVDIDMNLRKLEKKLMKLSLDWLRPITATMTLVIVIGMSIISSSTIQGQVYALFDNKLNSSEKIPVDQMTREQLIEEMKKLDTLGPGKKQTLGVYNDPAIRPPAYINGPHIDHIFVDWRESHYLAQQLLLNKQNKNTVLVTIEPRGNKDGEDLLKGIEDGRYDEVLNSLLEVISAYERPVYIRFAHEAELGQLYPWSNQDPSLYAAAFRHFVDYSKSQHINNIKWVWAPAGNHGAEAYYPGNKYVDIVGTTVLHDNYWYGDSQPTFYQLAEQRMWLFSFQKPVWVVEFGAGHSNPKIQNFIIKDALNSYKKLGFDALIYLNMVDANINGLNYILNDIDVLNINKPVSIEKNIDKKAAEEKNSIKSICKNKYFQDILFETYSYLSVNRITCSSKSTE